MYESGSESEEKVDNNLPNIINPLCITVIGSRNLPRPKDKSEAWTDKYALVRIGDTKQQTVTRSSNPSNVQWGDTLQFDIAGVPHGEEIYISVYINYTFSWEMLGEIRIPLDQYREVNRRFALEHWYPFGTGGGWKRDDVKEINVGEIGLIIGVFEGEGKRLKRRHVFSVDDPYFLDKGADEIYVEANDIAKENSETMTKIIRIAENTREIGAATLAKLSDQTEQIEQAQQDVDVINEQITYGEQKIATIESTCGGCCSCFEKRGKQDEHVDRLRAEAVRTEKLDKMRMKAKARAAREQRERDKAREKNKRFGAARPAPTLGSTAGAASPVVLTQEGEFKKTVREIDGKLDHTMNLVTDLKGLAADMGTELDKQNAELQMLNENSALEAARLARVTDKTKRLI
eukprot:TRINITY_DN2273_c0_g1_i1.p1 TRINITY_DN2273_c0_g1~~TRINITY_DN2273_c0_g1_i1.p1  ORF type:complete len:403 (-),score=111.54 TRINITY_DN2273_c0_g1_i1:64-1272(-)